MLTAGRVVSDSVLAQIVMMVSYAKRSRAPIKGVADKISAALVPTALAVSAALFVAWVLWGPTLALAYAITAAVSVLIVACPCALGLAIPISIITAVVQRAQVGVLFKDAEEQERMAGVDILIVEKAGTLTRGKPALTGVAVWAGEDETAILTLAAALEKVSEHPQAEAIVAGAAAKGIKAGTTKEFAAVTGKGVLIGIFAVVDSVRESTVTAITELHAQGVRIIIATGDNAQTAKAMAGEGVNDALALAAADVGIAQWARGPMLRCRVRG